jgi:hypothetical protein
MAFFAQQANGTENVREKMVRRNKINVVDMMAFDQFLQITEKFPQSHVRAKALLGDLVVLAERAFERATTEKYGA